QGEGTIPMALVIEFASSIWTVDCAGSPREIGRAHGETARMAIDLGWRNWSAAIAERHGMDADAYLKTFFGSTDYLPAIRAYAPDLLEEIEGIAEGSEQRPERILALNLLDEEWEYSKRGRKAPGCTVAAVADGTLKVPVLGQTMDIPSVHDGTQLALRIRPKDGPAVIVFAFAGMIGLMGCNEAGVGVVVNNLEVLPASKTGLPVSFVMRGILARRTLSAAANFVRDTPHATGQHYAIGAPDGFRAFEAWGGGVEDVPVRAGSYVHANHPLAASGLRLDPKATYAASRTLERQAVTEASAPQAHDQAGLEQVLMDTTAPVSREIGDGYMTFGAISMTLSAPPVVHIAPGPPHRTEWSEVGWEPGPTGQLTATPTA
ncbi:MAG: C45 family autoproteolytic acyltransferase/hydrolase, partial [Thermomicrobiales bacterium]